MAQKRSAASATRPKKTTPPISDDEFVPAGPEGSGPLSLRITRVEAWAFASLEIHLSDGTKFSLVSAGCGSNQANAEQRDRVVSVLSSLVQV